VFDCGRCRKLPCKGNEKFVGHGIICSANQSSLKRVHERLLRNPSLIGLFALQPVFAQVEPKAGTWITWVVSSVSQVRVPSPPTAADTTGEIQAIKSLMAEGNDTTRAQLDAEGVHSADAYEGNVATWNKLRTTWVSTCSKEAHSLRRVGQRRKKRWEVAGFRGSNTAKGLLERNFTWPSVYQSSLVFCSRVLPFLV
jgi:hypothetical protein